MRFLTDTLKSFFSANALVRAGAGSLLPALLLSSTCLAAPADSATSSSSAHPEVAGSERLVIRLINAETGRPMSHQNVVIDWDDDAEESTVFIGGQGRGTVQLLLDRANFTMRPASKNWGDPNRLAYFSCSGAAVAVSVAQATRDGFVAHNECNGRTAQAKPGEIVFWAHPLPLWVPDFQ